MPLIARFFGAILTVWLLFCSSLVGQDCNGNGVEDREDVRTGTSEDCNGDEVPDECEFAPLPFDASDSFHIPGSVVDLIARDFDGDSELDFALSYSGGVMMHLNRGGGEFDTVNHPLAGTSSRWGAGDLDADGDVDLVALFEDGVRVLVNRGDGQFDAGETVALPNLLGIDVGDLNGDGADDIVVANGEEDLISVLMGAPDGALSPKVDYQVGDEPIGVALGDIDADGDLDVAAANQTANTFSLLINDGDGTLQTAATVQVGGVHPESIGMADMNGDGRADVVVGDDFVRVFVQQGDLEFTPSPPFFVGSRWVADLGFGDLDEDGDVDVIAGTRTPGATYGLLNDGQGVLRSGTSVGTGTGALGSAHGDFDGDGDPDLAIGGRRDDSATIEWNNDAARAHFVKVLVEDTVPVFFEPHAGALADVDKDGDLDLLFVDGGASLYLMPNDGQGTFAPRSPERQFSMRANALFSLVVKDLNGDGNLDAAAMSDVQWLVHVLHGDGRGAFEYDTAYTIGAGRPFFMKDVDLNGDGLPELLTTNQGDNSLSILRNLGPDGFADAELLDVGSGPTSIAGADLDSDGDQDVIIASSPLMIFFNDGEGNLSRRVDFEGAGAAFVVTDDMDSDGDLDIITGGGSPSVALFENDGRGGFRFLSGVNTQTSVHSLATGDLNGDTRVDVITSNSVNGTISLVINLGGGELEVVRELVVGEGTRFAPVGDIDGDNDLDIVALNHDTKDYTVVRNRFVGEVGRPFLEGVCTEGDFFSISAPSTVSSEVRRVTKYLLPADPSDPELLPPLFHNVRRYPLHQQFLAAEFADRFAVEFYSQLVGDRATRKYFSGAVFFLQTEEGRRYGYNVLTNFDSDASELPTFEEVRGVHEQMLEAFTLRPLFYFPNSRITREDAATWPDTSFVHFGEADPELSFQAYTQGVGFGRVRLHTRASFDAANESGLISFQDIIVLDHAPRDIEGVVSGVVTAEPQSDLSHVAVRTARRGTPNAFVQDAFQAFQQHEGNLVRFEVTAADFTITPATSEEAEAFWDENRPQLSVLPGIDPEYQSFDRLTEFDLNNDSIVLENRFGGKASNFARLQSVLDGPMAQYREVGFGIPMHYYVEFLNAGRIPSARDPANDVSYAEYIAELENWPEFESDSQLRFSVLENLRDHMRENGVIDPELVSTLAARIEEVFGSQRTVVRFRSSSNAEDALEFNGAGLYDSTSVCALDDFDANNSGPSICDPTKNNERTIVRALKKVWASNWNFRAYEERAFFGMPQDLTAMGLLVSRAFLDETANGVVFTGNPDQALDNRYIVTAQVGEESVVSPEPGVVAEKNVLRVEEGRVVEIFRASPSTLTAPGEVVLTDDQLRELGALIWHIDQNFSIDTGEYSRRQVLLDLEFKVEPNGDLAVKQVRPFLRTAEAPPAPTFELQIPSGAASCGVFVHSRGQREALSLKSRLEFIDGIHQLPTDVESFTGELFAEVRFGDENEIAVPDGPGVFRWTAFSGGGTTQYNFRFEQTFRLSDGEPLTLRLQDLQFRGEGELSLDPPRLFDEEFLTRSLSLEGERGLTVRYSSCTYEVLPLWEVGVTAASGESFRLLERFEPAADPTQTGPASLVFAELDFGGGVQRQVIRYWDLLYGSIRHNRNVKYWVVLSPPVAVDGLAESVHVVEVVAEEPDLAIKAEVNYLNANFAQIATLSGLTFEKSIVSSGVGEDVPFSRGDVNGDGRVHLSDAVDLVSQLFRGTPNTSCWKIADADDDGLVDLSDAVGILLHLYGGAGPLAAPFGACGVDPTPDSVPCREDANCVSDG